MRLSGLLCIVLASAACPATVQPGDSPFTGDALAAGDESGDPGDGLELPAGPVAVSPAPSEFLDYEEIVALLELWSNEASGLVQYGEYGLTVRELPFSYLRMGTSGKPQVLITACIHGNEIMSTAATLWMMHRILSEYGIRDDVTHLLEDREIWWVPVVSPDSYLYTRLSDGVDPNHTFPTPSDPNPEMAHPVAAITELVSTLEIKAAISGHTRGEPIYYLPSLGPPEDQQVHREIAESMGALSGTPWQQTGATSGYDVDWYYLQGAVSVIVEFGVDGTTAASFIEYHATREYEAYLLLMRQGPEQVLLLP